ncbi:UDP-N-acetylmuramoyl-tripeptide--D-alanyl-D-alanine ligase [Sporosarcina thermotolerans]|uniref:UDP-N-acetylmuramoyl-tripeptide--D-alanyl-D-alanine ligase n=1 Tax=Sporosarcina thermotolerans TaxID=633404 RepID=A0AAW9A5M3_9BACL|nr:UDP-N-acetylmuramoyl-tripeptide--D-alanyl-D-alanine ligase [Sporosarcina thermotolerans]MDW0115470.1 UDP-N-acetylmuramoyl-tripeptide--D-alanyl-D-alanine ligase [Sporosarcina thermotolerans]WHT47205.1 UDP-N-acetylmuramoyl-tripeptide--D-alanyl-D-alanine ligase [Sporosarcina thermotolerans]
MRPLVVSEILKVLKGRIITGAVDWEVKDVIYYKRHEHVNRNTLLFVSRSDEINWAMMNKKGPSLIVTDKVVKLTGVYPNVTVMQVDSLVQSYWKFMNYYRNLFQIPVVTITGTCGKTTVKDMIRHILQSTWNVHSSVSSQNEPRRSLPYLMGIDDHTEAAVFEHGLGNTGNIKHQCMIYQPTIGIITTIGVHHLDGCGDLEGYIRAKEEIVGGIREGGTLILNADDQNTKKLRISNFKGKIIYFGTADKSHFKASQIKYGIGGMDFILHTGNRTHRAFIPGYGEHQVSNALAALAAVHEMGMDVNTAISRLKTFKNMNRHLEFSKGIQGSTIIDDTWTNNPTSVEAALKVLDSVGKDKNVILILGDINRLGNFERRYHREIGSMIAKRNISALITIGKKAVEIARQASRDGSTANIMSFENVNEIGDKVDHLFDEKSIVLIKGPMSSRGMIEFAKRLKK